MRAAYLKPVFDEWAILAVPAKTGGVVAYHGPRPDAFRRNLPDDAEPLRARAAGKEFTEGDIQHATQFRCANGDVINVYKTGKVVFQPRGEESDLSGCNPNLCH